MSGCSRGAAGLVLLGGRASRRRAGVQRLPGIAALEDKIVRRAVVVVLNAVREAGFRGFSCGFRVRRDKPAWRRR
jgi:hypothetical protein